MDENQLDNRIVRNTLRGDMIGVKGKTWILKEDLTDITWSAPREMDPNKINDVRNALKADIEKTVVSTDTYFGGKQMAAIARLALIADELGETALADTFR